MCVLTHPMSFCCLSIHPEGNSQDDPRLMLPERLQRAPRNKRPPRSHPADKKKARTVICNMLSTKMNTLYSSNTNRHVCCFRIEGVTPDGDRCRKPLYMEISSDENDNAGDTSASASASASLPLSHVGLVEENESGNQDVPSSAT